MNPIHVQLWLVLAVTVILSFNRVLTRKLIACTQFCLVVDVRDVITWFKFGNDRLRGFRSAEGQSLPFPIDFDGRPYNTLTLPWERVIWCETIRYFCVRLLNWKNNLPHDTRVCMPVSTRKQASHQLHQSRLSRLTVHMIRHMKMQSYESGQSYGHGIPVEIPCEWLVGWARFNVPLDTV